MCLYIQSILNTLVMTIIQSGIVCLTRLKSSEVLTTDQDPMVLYGWQIFPKMQNEHNPIAVD